MAHGCSLHSKKKGGVPPPATTPLHAYKLTYIHKPLVPGCGYLKLAMIILNYDYLKLTGEEIGFMET